MDEVRILRKEHIKYGITKEILKIIEKHKQKKEKRAATMNENVLSSGQESKILTPK